MEKLFAGSYVEDLIAGGWSGQSDFFVENWISINNLRKNRRVADHAVVAQILATADTLRVADPSFAERFDSLNSTTDCALLEPAQSLVSESGSILIVTEVVSKQAYKLGESFRVAALEKSSKSETADFYL